jgi:hypothetical protein
MIEGNMLRNGDRDGPGADVSEEIAVSRQRRQCAINTGRVALARTWRVTPPKII